MSLTNMWVCNAGKGKWRPRGSVNSSVCSVPDVQCIAEQYCAVLLSLVQCSGLQCSVLQCSSVQWSAVQYSAVQCSVALCECEGKRGCEPCLSDRALGQCWEGISLLLARYDGTHPLYSLQCAVYCDHCTLYWLHKT